MNKRIIVYIFFGFTLIGLLISIQMSVFGSLTGREFHLIQTLSILLMDLYVWILFIPLIDWVVRRFPFRSDIRMSNIAINIFFSLAAVSVKILLDSILLVYVFKDFIPHPEELPPFLVDFSFYKLFIFMLISPKSLIFLLVYWAFLAVIYSFRNSQKLREREIASSQLESQLAKAQLLALHMQIQPHFLFNTLNSISSLLRENVDAADEMITKLSDMLRYSLTNIDVHEVCLRDEIDFLKCYLEIEKIRFQERLNVEFDIQPNVYDARVPRMLLQPLVENSIRHGVSKQAKPGTVTIQARPVDTSLEITVQDTGPGIVLSGGQPIHEGVGLKTTRERLKQHFGFNYRLEFTRFSNRGTHVKVTIPYVSTKE